MMQFDFMSGRGTPDTISIILYYAFEEAFGRVQRTNKSPFLKSYLQKVDTNSHPSPLCPLCNTHTHDTHHLFNCIHIRTSLSPMGLCTDPAGVTELLASWKEKLVDHKKEDRISPLAKVKGVGRQQQQL